MNGCAHKPTTGIPGLRRDLFSGYPQPVASRQSPFPSMALALWRSGFAGPLPVLRSRGALRRVPLVRRSLARPALPSACGLTGVEGMRYGVAADVRVPGFPDPLAMRLSQLDSLRAPAP